MNTRTASRSGSCYGSWGVGESTYYEWVRQAEQPCDRDLLDSGLLCNIHQIWEASGQTYGADRVHRQLRRDGIRVGRKASSG